MLATRLRGLALAAVAVAALLAVWLTLAPGADTAAGTAPPTSAPSSGVASTRPVAALDSLDPPDDLGAARQVARRFATSLYRDDLATVRHLATAELARELGLDQPTESQPAAPTSSVRVDGITTEDLRPDQVLLQVTVDRDGRLETATLSVARTDSGWRVAEAAF